MDAYSNHIRKCKGCNCTMAGAERMLQHVAGLKDSRGRRGASACSEEKVIPEHRALCQALVEEAQKVSEAKVAAVRAQAQKDAAAGHKQSSLDAFVVRDGGKREAADKSVANYFFESGAPPSHANHPAFKGMLRHVSAFGAGYEKVAPNRVKILGPMLKQVGSLYPCKYCSLIMISQSLAMVCGILMYLILASLCCTWQAVVDVKEHQKEMMEIEKTTGVCIESDGCTNVKRTPLINWILSSPEGGRFDSATNTSGHVKSAAYLLDETLKCIEKVFGFGIWYWIFNVLLVMPPRSEVNS